jgi:hypothetical protein
MPVVMPGRIDYPAFLIAHGLTGQGAEIGTWRGGYAATLLEGWPGTLHCVDPYSPDVGWVDPLTNVTQAEFDEVEQNAKERLAPWLTEGRCIIHKATSVDASTQPWAKDLDFVYIDAQHSYISALQDCKAWWPAVKSGGFLSGHDYLDGNIAGVQMGVRQAVTEFVASLNLPPDCVMTTGTESYPSWFVWKP